MASGKFHQYLSRIGTRVSTAIPKTYNGSSVNLLISLMASLVSFELSGPVARIPTPPAFDTAATSLASEIQLIPGKTTG